MSCEEMGAQAQLVGPPVVNARLLRGIAEAAAGFRGKRAFLVERDDGTLAVVEPDGIGNAKVLLECSTPLDVVNRPNLVKMCVQVRRGTGTPVAREIDAKYDALFWTESSVEKFLLGYYSRLVPPQEIIEFLNSFNKEDVFAVAHLPKSVAETLPIPDNVFATEDDIPFRVLTDRGQAVGIPEFITIREYLGLL